MTPLRENPPREAEEATETAAVAAEPEAAETASALPVLAEGPVVGEVRPARGGLSRASSPAFAPAVQAAAAAAGGFLAGAAVIGLVNRRQRRARLVRRTRPGRPSRMARGRGPARGGELVQIVGSRSLLVDVHLLAER